jgi:hypothetical protein
MAKLHPKTPWDHFTVAQICELVVKKAITGWGREMGNHDTPGYMEYVYI